MSEPSAYNAVVHAVVGKKATEDSWEMFVQWVSSKLQQGLSVDALFTELAAVETQVKHDFGITTLPATWRSNKSTVLSALAAGVDILDGGAVVPKSKLAKAVKAMRQPLVTTIEGPADAFREQVAPLLYKYASSFSRDDYVALLQRVKMFVEHELAMSPPPHHAPLVVKVGSLDELIATEPTPEEEAKVMAYFTKLLLGEADAQRH